MTKAGLKNHFSHWRDWEINPVVIKELRQGVRSTAVTGVLVLFLIILFVVSLGSLISETAELNANSAAGLDLLRIFMGILTVASLVFIPLYTGIRVAAERQENNLDLLYVSTLPPHRIILGKLFCGAYIALLFICSCLPFMALTNLMRGVDLPSLFVELAFLFLIVCTVNSLAVCLACAPVSRIFKALLFLGLVILSLILSSILFGGGFLKLNTGLGSRIFEEQFWIAVGTWIGICGAIIGFFYFIAVAAISPPSANRALPLRGYLSVVWLISGVLCVWTCWVSAQTRPTLVWAAVTMGLSILCLLGVINNSDDLSPRVRRDLAKTKLPWPIAFLFFNGAAGGMVWLTLICAITPLVVAGFNLGSVVDKGEIDNFLQCYVPAILYSFGYCLTALLIQRRFIKNRRVTALVAILLAAAWGIIPNLILIFTAPLNHLSHNAVQYGNIVDAFHSDSWSESNKHTVVACIWVGLVLILNSTWFVRQVHAFKPLPKPTQA